MASEARAPQQRTRSVARAAWPSPSGAAAHPHPSGRPATGVTVVRRFRHRWTDLFGLVLDLEHYPAFVPHCRAVKVYTRTAPAAGATVIVSRMTVGVAAFDVSYANRTVGDAAARKIEVEALDGPLSRLHVVWTFEPDGEDWTRVGFSVDYAFNSPILAAVACRVFDAMFAEIIGAFERRADRLFGRPGARG
jgi:coenzyme Q-binding protein COQ10